MDGDSLNARIGRKVRQLRLKRGISVTEFAEKVGCTKGQIGLLESGKRRWNSDWIEWAADVLKVSPKSLVRG
jgi:transcriptional regulator with XRE-family HTH domain